MKLLLALLALTGIGVGVELIRYLETLRATTAQVQIELKAYRVALLNEMHEQAKGIRQDIFSGAVPQVLAVVDKQLTGATDKVVATVDRQADKVVATVDRQTDKLIATVDRQSDKALARVDTFTATVKPTVDGMNLMMRPNAVPAQVLGVLGATKVTMGAVAKTSITIEKATPALTDAAVKGGKELTAIAADGHKMADQLTKPKTFWGKAWEVVKLLSRCW
jgi:hypothetical protein